VNLCFKLLEEHLISRSIGHDAELYKCAADLVGPSQLFTVTTKIVSYWKPRRKILNDRVVDLTKDHQLNQTQSPIFHVNNIRVPLIMAHGKNDVVVNPGESERMFQALKDNRKAVQYVIYKDEVHGRHSDKSLYKEWHSELDE
jgi:dipeptidyl aminopeptidase/acylaminoacyl peptidase